MLVAECFYIMHWLANLLAMVGACRTFAAWRCWAWCTSVCMEAVPHAYSFI
jgi:hypothetical protein